MKSSLDIYSAIKVLLLVSLIIPLAGCGKKEALDSPSDNRMRDVWHKDASAQSLVNDYLKTNRLGEAAFIADGSVIVVAQASISSSGSLLKAQNIAKLRAISDVCQFLFSTEVKAEMDSRVKELSSFERKIMRSTIYSGEKDTVIVVSAPLKSEQSVEYSVEDAHGVLSMEGTFRMSDVYKDNMTHTFTAKERISMAEDGSVESEISIKDVESCGGKRTIWGSKMTKKCSGKIRGLSEIASWRQGDSIYRAFLLPAQPLYAKTKQSGKQNQLKQKDNNKENYDN